MVSQFYITEHWDRRNTRTCVLETDVPPVRARMFRNSGGFSFSFLFIFRDLVCSFRTVELLLGNCISVARWKKLLLA